MPWTCNRWWLRRTRVAANAHAAETAVVKVEVAGAAIAGQVVLWVAQAKDLALGKTAELGKDRDKLLPAVTDPFERQQLESLVVARSLAE